MANSSSDTAARQVDVQADDADSDLAKSAEDLIPRRNEFQKRYGVSLIANFVAPERTGAKLVRWTATNLISRGFWVVACYPPGYVQKNGTEEDGKRPIGKGWGAKRATASQIVAKLEEFPDANLGVVLGPSRALGGKWLADFEGDGDHAEESFLALTQGEDPATLAFQSTRGSHRLFEVDGDRLQDVLRRCKATEGTGISAGVYHLPELPDLEFRIGGLKEDGSVKQIQSVIPPSASRRTKTKELGPAREWIHGLDAPLASLPEAAYAYLERIAAEKQESATEVSTASHGSMGESNRFATSVPAGASAEDRAIKYLDKVDPAISGQNGHGTAFRAACSIGPGFNLPPSVTKRLLMDHYNPRCQPRWSEQEIDHKVEDSYRVEHRRGWLLDSLMSVGGHHTNGNGCHQPESPSPRPDKGIDYRGLSEADLGIISAESVEMVPIKWEWKYRMASGELTLIAGEGGEGKSQIALAIAATITRGAEWWDKSGRASVGDVIIVSAEDDRSTTLKPRLTAVGADLSRVTFLTAKSSIERPGKTPLISMESLQSIDYWDAVLDRRPECKLMIFDPLPSYLGRGVNDSKNTEIRQILEPFLDLIVRPRKLAMLAITHLNKSVDLKSPVHRITGSIAYANVPRNVHFVSRDPDAEGRAFFAMAKCNNAPKNLPALAFSIHQAEIPGKDGEPIETSFPIFEDETVDIKLRDIVSGEPGHRGPKADNTFAEWLWAQLEGGEQTIVDLVERARAEGLLASPADTNPKPSIVGLYNAKTRLKILHDGWTIEELSTRGMQGVRGKKMWRLALDPFKQLGNSEPL